MSEIWDEKEKNHIGNRENQESVPNENSQYDFWSAQAHAQKKENQEEIYQPNFTIIDQNQEAEDTVETTDVTTSENAKEDNINFIMSENSKEEETEFTVLESSKDCFNQEAAATKEKDSKEKKKTVMWWVKLAAGAAIFGLVAGIAFQCAVFIGGGSMQNQAVSDGKIESNSSTKTTIEKTSTNTSNTGKSMPDDVSKVVDATMPSIVSITSTITTTYNYYGQSFDKDTDGSGSGVIFDQNDKEILIVTNNHVIANAKKIGVSFVDGETVNAEVKGTDITSDLAVISIKTSNMKKDTLALIKPITVGSSDDIKVGQLALAIGNALGYGQSLTVGYISAKDREVAVDNNTMKLLQTDAAINPGNSGGALLNKDGQLIGINSMKYADTDVEGMGYAIPISVAAPIINELAEREVLEEDEKGYLGISGTNVTEEISEGYNMPEGVYVSQVSENSGAKEAGIVKGDIIVKLNGTEVKTISALKERVNAYRVGTKIKLTIKRSENGTYKEKEVEVVLKGQKTIDSLDGDNSNKENNNNGSNNNDSNGSSQQNPYGNGQSIEDFFNDYFGY